MRWLALAVALCTVGIAVWIVLPPPNYFLLRFAVGAPELSAWLVVASIVGLVLAIPQLATSNSARFAIAACIVTIALAAGVLLRVRATAKRFDEATRALSAEPAAPLRRQRLSVVDLFRGIPIGKAKITRGIVFAAPDGQRLTIDAYQPESGGIRPIVVQIYGGAWRNGAPGDFAKFARWLAGGGYVVFSIDYRHSPRWRWPAHLDDVNSALAWIAVHGSEYGGDTSRVVLLGRSAGAHLALLAAYRPSPLTVRGVVGFYAPVDLADAYRNPPRPDPLGIRDVERAFIGGPPDRMPEAYAAASPISYAKARVPPTLLIFGGRDNIVEPRYGRRLRDTLSSSGNQVAYLEIPWAEHAFDEVFNGPSSQLALFYAERFIAAVTRRTTRHR
jgi:acetyl esterase/lipase